MSSSTSALAMINGATSGTNTFDAQTYVNQIIAGEQGPLTLMQQQVSSLSAQGTALGTISGQLSDLQTAAFALNDFEGALDAQDATSSNTAVATATAAAGASAGTHTLTVGNLATTSSQYSDTLADGDTTFATGSFNLQIGGGTPTTITVDSTDNTLNGLANAINGQNLGVTADVVTDANGARLTLVSNQSGAPGQITLSGNTTGLTFTQAQAGVNANFSFDGVSLASASNSIDGVVPGVTLNLQATSTAPVQITVAPDTTQMTTAIQNFVTAYNTVVESMNAQFTYNTSTNSTGPLGSDQVLMNVQQQILGDAAYAISGNDGYTNLASIGVNMADDGSLSIDTPTLNAALAADPSAVVNLFQATGSNTGFAENIVNNLLTLTDPTNGPLTVDQNGVTQSTTSLNQDITDFQNQLNAQEQQLLATYSQVAVTLQQMPTLLSQTESQLNSLG